MSRLRGARRPRLGWMALSVVLLLCLPPRAASAAETVNVAKADAVRFEVVLSPDGSALVTETWDFTFTGGAFIRFYRDVPRPAGCAFSDFSAWVDGAPCALLEAPDPDAPAGCFAVEDRDTQVYFELYHDSTDQSRTFALSYRIDRPVVVYHDTAELRLELVGRDNSFGAVERASLTVQLPDGARAEEVRAWLYTEHHEQLPVADPSVVSAIDTEVSARLPFSVRIVAPPALFPDAARRVDQPALERILQEEADTGYLLSYGCADQWADGSPCVYCGGGSLHLFLILAALLIGGWIFVRRRRRQREQAARRDKAAASAAAREDAVPPDDGRGGE